MIAFLLAASIAADVRLTSLPDIGPNAYYIGNRAPVMPSPFRKLPIGAIHPEGWVRQQLVLEANGFVGHLTEISGFLNKKNNAWLSPSGEGEHGWEEVPYWLKGFGDLGYVLNDNRIKTEARQWIDGVLSSQREDGWFGPRANLTPNNGHPDVWPNMVMLNALQTYHEYSGDERVIRLMRKYFRWELNQPDDAFLLSYWEHQRGGDNIASVYWLYNRTGEPWLLDLVKKIHRRTSDWVDGVPDWHGVNFAQAFREPAEYGLLTHDRVDAQATEQDYETMRHRYGEVPGGMYGADENARQGYSDPRQAAETCAMVEMMLSDEMLLADYGDSRWAERCEDVAFNSLPASMTPDLKALHYLTAPNMPLVDARSKAPGVQNSGPMFLFNPWDHRCCQHNVSHGWPYYAEHLWLASANNGMAVALYAPCTVTARAGDGTRVTIDEKTDYPFGETVTFDIKTEHPNSFPLTFRMPSWCTRPFVSLSKGEGRGEGLIAVSLPKGSGRADGSYATVTRTWHSGDRLILHLPMHVEVKHWPANHESVSVQRGPLTYSLKIGEKYKVHGGTAAWPAEDLLPTTPWNYGLVNDGFEKVIPRKVAASGQPFTPETATIEIEVHARRIPEWQLDHTGLVNALQDCPARSASPIETVRLIPMGAARIRIASFPTVSTSPSANEWVAPSSHLIPASSSHTWNSDTTDALNDGILPKQGSGDQSIPRFTWWDHRGGTEWVEYDFSAARTLSHSAVYWFDDRAIGGGCRVPQSWRLLAWDGSYWRPVVPNSEYGTARDRFNPIEFSPIKTTKLRLEANLAPRFSGGILEWQVK